jgi:hypothetical protein
MASKRHYVSQSMAFLIAGKLLGTSATTAQRVRARVRGRKPLREIIALQKTGTISLSSSALRKR